MKEMNITQRVGDGTLGMPDLVPFDCIMVAAVAEAVPRAFPTRWRRAAFS
jgi:protein-L-isoaspartate O-methyltransferase